MGLITGTNNDDGLWGTTGDDTLVGLRGNDVLTGREGNDVLDGGEGFDLADYYNATGPVTVNLSWSGPQLVSPTEGSDTLVGIEAVVGGVHDDLLIGSVNGHEYLEGRDGNDTLQGGGGDGDNLHGGAGDDLLDGGTGLWDSVTYDRASSGVTVDLTKQGSGQVIGGGQGTDTLVGIEGIWGSAHNDTLTGDSQQNSLGGDGGDDLLDGGAGHDNVSYWNATGGVTVSLALQGQAQDVGGGHGKDTLVGFEAIVGSQYNDTLTGDADHNYFNPQRGNDVVDGGAGYDMVDYRDITDGVHVNLSITSGPNAWSSLGADALRNVEGVSSFSGADHLIGNDGDNTFQARGGNDTIDGGGGGNDNVVYWEANAGVTVDLAITTEQDVGADQGRDTIFNIENVQGGRYADTISGDSGNNWFDGGDGDDKIDGRGGFDMVSYHQATAGVTINLTLNGSQVGGAGVGQDTLLNIENLHGSTHDDVLIGNAADNFIDADAGDDLLDGGDGLDFLLGGEGADTLQGGAERDNLEGGRGDDNLDGGAGSEDYAVYRNAGGGVNVSLSAVGRQTVGGGEGADLLIGIENLHGSAYNDTLTGDAGTNRFNAGAGDDVVDGGAGDFDQLQFWDAASGVTVNLSLTTAQSMGAGLGMDTILNVEEAYGSQHNDNFTGSGGRNFLGGDAGADTLSGLGGDDNLSGGDGDDSLDGGDANDNLSGGQGDDRLVGGAGFDNASYWGASGAVTVDLSKQGAAQTVGGGEGVDTLFGIENLGGSMHGDVLSGDEAGNFINGEAGDDSISGRGGNDQLLGLSGADTLAGDAGNDNLQGGQGDDRLEGGDGFDNAGYFSATGAVTVDLAIQGVAQTVGADQGQDTLVSIENLGGSNGFGDVLSGDNAGNQINGNGGSDTLSGRGGEDVLIGGAGDDRLDGGEGLDYAIYSGAGGAVNVSLAVTGPQNVGGGQGLDTLINVENLQGSNFGDTLTGGADGNILVGLGGGDTLSGLAGNDVLVGGAGNDLLEGGEGADVAYYFGVRADYEVTDLGGGSFSVRHLNPVNNEGHDTITGMESARFADEVLALGGPPADPPLVLTGTVKADTLTGAGGNDRITGDNGDDLISGAGGADELFGENGQDTLLGGAGNDLLAGGNGKDLLDGGTGSDTLTGGTGSDLFVFSGGQDLVTDFDKGADRVDVSGRFANFGQLSGALTDVTGGVVIDFGGGETLSLAGVSKASLSAADFVFV
jgi:Ca2+-binding RTX toxin-like protein